MFGFILLSLLTPEAPFEAPYLVRTTQPAAESKFHPRYNDCLKLVTDDLEIGRVAAQQWAEEGGGALAHHCLAIADIAAGFPKLGAARLASISERKDAGDPKTRALVLGEAALAWLDGNETDLAETAIEKALEFAPDLADLQIVAAKVYAAGEQWELAENAVTKAEDAKLVTAEAFVIRGKARQALGRNFDAAEDVVAALTLDPFNLDALVLRGELHQAGVVIETQYTDEPG